MNKQRANSLNENKKETNTVNIDAVNANTDWFTLIFRLVMLGALLVVTMISLLSELGVHPDEWDVSECMKWGITHWIWPDMRAQGLGDTYSWYGYTKACNYTPYFLIMGKIAGVFKRFMDVLPYYRMPNLLLMVGMTVFMIIKAREKKYLWLAFGVCVQAWYIFAYVTADALDFVWAFVAIYLLADENSLLWITLRGWEGAGDNTDGTIEMREGHGLTARYTARCVVLGLLYGMMLLGKPYYYANMVITFVVLLIHLVKSSFSDRKQLWIKYLIIVGVCCLVFLARFGLDVHYYGGDKAAIKNEMSEIYSSDDKKPSTPVEEQCITYHMAEKGYSVADLFKYDEHWGLKSYRSFVSARVTLEGEDWYYVLMALLYAAIYVWIGVESWRNPSSSDEDGARLESVKYDKHKSYIEANIDSGCKLESVCIQNRIVFVCGTLLNVGGIIASVMNSYLIDAQAQGRYLLPILLTTSYLASRVPRLWENKGFKMLVLAAGVLSVAYFGLYDSRKLIDLAYVRGLFG